MFYNLAFLLNKLETSNKLSNLRRFFQLFTGQGNESPGIHNASGGGGGVGAGVAALSHSQENLVAGGGLPNEISAPYEVPQFPIEQIENKLQLQRQLNAKWVQIPLSDKDKDSELTVCDRENISSYAVVILKISIVNLVTCILLAIC